MSTAEQRRRELEEKKAKLAEMKRARDERMAAANQARQPVSRGPVSDERGKWVVLFTANHGLVLAWLCIDTTGSPETRGGRSGHLLIRRLCVGRVKALFFAEREYRACRTVPTATGDNFTELCVASLEIDGRERECGRNGSGPG